MKVLTQWTYKADDYPGYSSDLPNMALPDESYTLRDLQNKYSTGTIQSVVLQGQYDDPDAPLDAPLTPDRLHLTDPVDVDRQKKVIDEYIQDTTEKVNKKLNDYKDKQASEHKQANNNDATTTNDDATINKATDAS